MENYKAYTFVFIGVNLFMGTVGLIYALLFWPNTAFQITEILGGLSQPEKVILFIILFQILTP